MFRLFAKKFDTTSSALSAEEIEFLKNFKQLCTTSRSGDLVVREDWLDGTDCWKAFNQLQKRHLLKLSSGYVVATPFGEDLLHNDIRIAAVPFEILEALMLEALMNE